jgi:hypothetical protein
MNFCLGFAARLLQVLVDAVQGSDKQKGVLFQISEHWKYRAIDGFSLADVTHILTYHGGLSVNDLGTLNADIVTFVTFLGRVPQDSNEDFSQLTGTMRAGISPSSSLEGSFGGDLMN